MSTHTTVAKLPPCQFHNGVHDAEYDFKTAAGPWGNGCQAAFDLYGVGLGTGRGQKLVLEAPSAPDQYQELMRRREIIQEAWMAEVAVAKSTGLTGVDFWTYGPVLGSTGGLRLTARDRESRPIFELALMPGEDRITRTEVPRG